MNQLVCGVISSFCMFIVHMYITMLFHVGATSFSGAHFGKGVGPIHLDAVSCIGNESALVQCNYNRINQCTHSNDAGARCSPPGIWTRTNVVML